VKNLRDKSLLYTRTTGPHTNAGNTDNSPMPKRSMKENMIYTVFHEKETTRSYYSEGSFPDFPGFVPTVNLSWFVAMSYLANLIYVTEHDHLKVIQISNEVTRVYRESMLNKWFADLLLPVPVSNQWSAVYDTDIQYLLGFYSLCSFIFGKNYCRYPTLDRNVHLGICLMHFLLYLRLRCVIDENRLSDVGVLVFDWKTHVKDCTDDKNANNGRIILRTIL